MNKFHIPEKYISSFSFLKDVEEEKFESLIKCLTKVPVGTGPEGFHSTLSTLLGDAPPLFSEAIFSFGKLLSNKENDSIQDIGKALFLAYSHVVKPALESEQIKLEHRLVEVLNSLKNTRTTFKAIDLLGENDKTFRESRIVSDIRLIFNNDVHSEERNAVIIHKLRVEYLQSGKIEEQYFSLDNKDLIKLKEKIDRALEKERVIRKDFEFCKFIDLTD